MARHDGLVKSENLDIETTDRLIIASKRAAE